jgi:hypothetical protein
MPHRPTRRRPQIRTRIAIGLILAVFALVIVRPDIPHAIKWWVHYMSRTWTPPADTTLAPLSLQTNEPELTVPVDVYYVRSPRSFATRRDPADLERLIANASAIYHQANITLVPGNVHEINLPRSAFADSLVHLTAYASHIAQRPDYDPTRPAVIFAKKIKTNYFLMPHGQADLENSIVAVTDRVDQGLFDYTIVAHELAHVFGLDDLYRPRIPGRLMSARGTGFSTEEIATMRQVVGERFLVEK